MPTRLLYARVFIPVNASGRAGKLPDAIMNAIITDKKIPTEDSTPPQAFRQVFTKGEVAINIERDMLPTGNDQQGDNGLFIKSMKIKITLPLEITSFEALLEYASLDPDAPDGATAGVYKENSGVNLSNSGVSLLIYDKSTDNENDSDVPDFTRDKNVQVFFNAIVISNIKLAYNGEQDIFNLEFTAMANITSTGIARGKKGSFGTFTVA